MLRHLWPFAGRRRQTIALHKRSRFPLPAFPSRSVAAISRRRLLVVTALLLIASAATLFCLGPLLTPTLFRLWINSAAGPQNVEISWSDIDARLFQPIVVRGVKIRSRPANGSLISVDIDRAELDFRLAAILDSSRGRSLRHLSLEGIRGEVRKATAVGLTSAPTRRALPSLKRLIADSFTASFDDFRTARGHTTVELHGASISANELESGRFTARDVVVGTPWFRKSFPNLRGATSWEYDRLTIGALSLSPGLDMDAITFDLAHVANGRLGVESHLDAFGGKLRANISTVGKGWDVAGTATQISLAQASDALQFSNRASGTIVSSKFTFRGDVANLAESTASIWTEIDGFTWRDRTADTIMLGASLYRREIQIDQIYVKQRENQLTLSGESALPRKRREWPDFRGDLSASINDLGDFARLFGAKPAEFSGAIEINGSVSEQEHKFGGELVASGNSLTLFGAPVDALNGRFTLRESELLIEQCELRHDRDFAMANGSLDLRSGHRFTGRFAASIIDLAPYENFLAWTGDFLEPEGSISLEGQADAVPPTGAGTFHVRAHSLRPKAAPSLLPFDAELAGTYTADKVFFRTFSLRNEHAAFNTFATVAADYVQLQALRFDVNGKAVLEGECYLPFTLSIPPENGRWFTGIVPDSAYDVDLRLTSIDLGEIAAAMSPRRDFAGKLEARLRIFGTTEIPEANFTLRARDVALGERARLSADIDGTAADGVFELKANFAPTGSGAFQLECSLPFEYQGNAPEYRVRRDVEFNASVNAPALPFAKLPGYLQRHLAEDGILRGKIFASGFWPHPELRGTADFADVRSGKRTISARVSFDGSRAKIDGGKFTDNAATLAFAGKADITDATAAIVKLRTPSPFIVDRRALLAECIRKVQLSSENPPDTDSARANQAEFRGPIFGPNWTLGLTESGSADVAEISEPFCLNDSDAGEILTLNVRE